MKTRKALLLILPVLFLLLSGCAAPAGEVPRYVVILTPSQPFNDGRYTGAARHVLTAAHCVDDDNAFDRVLTQYGQESRIVSVARDVKRNVAIVAVNPPLFLPVYAGWAGALSMCGMRARSFPMALNGIINAGTACRSVFAVALPYRMAESLASRLR